MLAGNVAGQVRLHGIDTFIGIFDDGVPDIVDDMCILAEAAGHHVCAGVVIGIGGRQQAVLACVRAGFATTLITDSATAAYILGHTTTDRR